MKNSKFQAPTANEPPTTKLQAIIGRAIHFGRLKPGVSLVLGCWCLVLTFCFSTQAQNYSINWHKIAGGGGTSTNQQYTLSGTIGQPDAGLTMTNGQYSLTGGFWALPQAVQTPGAPTLTIVPAGPGQATIAWTPATGTNWVLQETLSLSPANWVNSPSGSSNPVVVPATNSTMFYRLFKP